MCDNDLSCVSVNMLNFSERLANSLSDRDVRTGIRVCVDFECLQTHTVTNSQRIETAS